MSQVKWFEEQYRPLNCGNSIWELISSGLFWGCTIPWLDSTSWAAVLSYGGERWAFTDAVVAPFPRSNSLLCFHNPLGARRHLPVLFPLRTQLFARPQEVIFKIHISEKTQAFGDHSVEGAWQRLCQEPGCWSWQGFCPDVDRAQETSLPSLSLSLPAPLLCSRLGFLRLPVGVKQLVSGQGFVVCAHGLPS